LRLPPLTALRAFDSAARCGSFTRAAAELHITHGAISRHVAALEAHFGKSLFIRHARGVELTADGRRFQEAVRDAIDRLAQAAREISGREITRGVQVSTLPSFATRWLLPRVPQFNQAHPGIDIEIRTEHEFVDFERRATAPDFAIRYGRGGWKALRAERLLGEHLRPVCAPGAIASKADVDMRALLSRYPLVHDSNEDGWNLWLASTGIRLPPRAPTALRFNDYNLVVEAAAQKLGVALGRTGLIEAELANGRLVEFSRKVRSPRAYYLVCRSDRPLSRHVRVLWDWLLITAKAGEGSVINVNVSLKKKRR
jgi:LysR family transcriptional regulator, glycine cleavage system transcriptional activator